MMMTTTGTTIRVLPRLTGTKGERILRLTLSGTN